MEDKGENDRSNGKGSDDVDWTGAALLSSANMTERQERVLGQILLRIYELGDAEQTHLRRANFVRDDYLRAQEIRRPRHVFFIDGARGSGKTSMLLTLGHYLKALGNSSKWESGEERWKSVTTHLKHVRTELDEELRKTYEDLTAAADGRLSKWKKISTEQLFEAPHLDLNRKNNRRTACLLPMLLPSDLENSQSVMEGIFSIMAAKLKRQSEKRQNEKGRKGETDKDAEALKKTLYEQVAKGWHLAASKRDESIRAYSYNLDDYFKVLGKTGADSYARVHSWSVFVNDYLDYFNDQLLVIFIDDTDVAPQTTADILHTIRIFLDHPRIVTVLAGNLRSMRHSLIWHLLQTLKDPIEVLAAPTSGTAIAWRRQVRHQIEEYLEKILPRSSRFFLSVQAKVELSDSDGAQGRAGLCEEDDGEPRAASKEAGTEEADGEKRQRDDDFCKVVRLPFDDYCRQKLSDLRDSFLRVKVGAFQRQRRHQRELQTERERHDLENFLAWWLYRHWYGQSLRPRSIRQLRTLVGLTGATPSAPEVSRRVAHEHPKRLAVILFEAPENHELIDRFSDADTHVGKWLRQQPVRSSWRGERYFEVGERKLYRGTYGYEFVCFRLDLGITMPLLENPDDQLPVGLLPRMSGQNMTGMAPFFPEMLPQPMFGVSRRIQHSVLPSNCAYFHDLQCLPNVAFVPGLNSPHPMQESKALVASPWDTNLIYNWPDLFDLESASDNRSAGNAASQALNGKIATYLREIVLPLGSLELGRFTRGTRADATSSNLLIEIENTEGFTEERDTIDSLRRHYDYYNHFADTKLGGVAAESLAAHTVERWNEWVQAALLLKEDKNTKTSSSSLIKRKVAESFEAYQALINDIRKAWHAGRILINQMPPSKMPSKHFEASRRNHFSESDRYTIPSLDAIRNEWINRSRFSKEAFERLSQPLPSFFHDQSKASGKHRTDHKLVSLEELLTSLSDSSSDSQRIWNAFCATGMLDIASARLKGQSESPGVFSEADVELVLPRKRAKKEILRESAQIDSSCADDVQLARYAKYVFLYFWALGPCIPALMHLECAASVYHEQFKGSSVQSRRSLARGKKSLTDIVTRWREFLRDVATYYVRYRASVELSLARLELIGDWKDGKRASVEHGVKFTMIPDISFGSMGTQGLAGFKKKLRDEFEGSPLPSWYVPLMERIEKHETPAPIDGLQKSVFGDLEEKLLCSWRYLDKLEKYKESGAARSQRAKAPKSRASNGSRGNRK